MCQERPSGTRERFQACISSSTTVVSKLHCASVLPGGLGKQAHSWAPASETLSLQIWGRPGIRGFFNEFYFTSFCVLI